MLGKLIGTVLFASLLVSILGCASGDITPQPTVAKREYVTVRGGLLIPYGEAVRLIVPHESVSATLFPLLPPSEREHGVGQPSAQLLGMLPQGRRLVLTPPETQSATTHYALQLSTTRGDIFTAVLFIPDPGFRQVAQLRKSTPSLPQSTSSDRTRGITVPRVRPGSETIGASTEDSETLTHEQLAQDKGLPADLAEAAKQGGMSVQEFDNFLKDMNRVGGNDTLKDSETWNRIASGDAAGVLADQTREFFDIPDGVADKASAENIVWMAKTIMDLGGTPSDSGWYEDFGGTVRDHLDVPKDATKGRDVNSLLKGMEMLQMAGSKPSDPGAWEALAEGERQGKAKGDIILARVSYL